MIQKSSLDLRVIKPKKKSGGCASLAFHPRVPYYGEPLGCNRQPYPSLLGWVVRHSRTFLIDFPRPFEMKQIEFSPKVVTICELTAIPDLHLVIPRSGLGSKLVLSETAFSSKRSNPSFSERGVSRDRRTRLCGVTVDTLGAQSLTRLSRA